MEGLPDVRVLGIPVSQAVVYPFLIHYAFRVPVARAIGAAVLRIALGAFLFFFLAHAVKGTWPTAVILLLSASTAWACVSMLDPRRSLRRVALWVIVGTVVSLVMDLTYFHWVELPVLDPERRIGVGAPEPSAAPPYWQATVVQPASLHWHVVGRA
jgi:hypothetical protein